MELGIDNFVEAERLFGRSLMSVLNVKLWTVYLNYIRRRNDLTNDATGQARRTVAQSYDFVIDNIGVDRDSGNIWQDYINFVKSGPGQVGGPGWQDQQKMDQLRKAYQRAIAAPMLTVNNMWREYDQFEMALNKVTVRNEASSLRQAVGPADEQSYRGGSLSKRGHPDTCRQRAPILLSTT